MQPRVLLRFLVGLSLGLTIAAGNMPAVRASPAASNGAPACVPAPIQGASTVYALADHRVIYLSEGGAGGWHAVSDGLPPGIGVYAVGLDSVSKDVLYAGTTGAGIYKTFNGGAHWFSANDESVLTTFVYAMAVNPEENSQVYAGGDDAVYRSIDGGLTWEQGNIGLPDFLIYTIALDAKNPNIVYVGTDSAGVYRSDPQFDTWSSASTGLPVGSAVRALVTDPNHMGTLYAGTDAGLYKTANGGDTWQAVGGGLPSGQPVLAVALVPNNTHLVYAGTAQGLYLSADGGSSWTHTTGQVGTSAISAVAVDPINPQTLYVATGATIWQSTNSGQAWTIVNQGMPATAINVLAVFHPTLTPTSPCLPPPGTGKWQFFPQTGHTVAGPFLTFYQANGGQAIFGLPRTEAIQDTKVAPDASLVQYFDNSLLELRNGRVQIADIGDMLTANRQPFSAGPATTGTPQHRFFQLGGRNVSDLFLRFWRQHGGEAVLGMPISDEIHESNDDGTGARYQLQFFDKARLEYHPELHGSAVVQLGKLGDELLRQRGWL